MTQCERCGASNQAQSRFCVSCGSPLLTGSTGAHHAPAPVQPAPVQPAPAYPAPRGPAPAWDPSVQPAQHMPHASPVYHEPAPSMPGPPSSGLPFAETASPASFDPNDPVRRAREAALAAQPPRPYGSPHGSGGYAAPAYPVPTNPPPHGHYPQATAAMPGVAQDPERIAEGAPRILAGFLVSYEGNALGTFWPLFQGRNVVGREGAPLQLDVRIAHPTTSSRHAVILAAALPGRIKVEDAGSTNGTFVNDARLSPGQPMEVRDGDRVRFGLFPAVVKIV